MNDDLISRQAAIDALNEQIWQCDKALSSFDISMKDEYAVKVERASLVAYKEQLEALPSAQPERKTGKWIDETFKPWGLVYHPYKCDQCGEHSEADSDYCPNCGADMRGEQDE